MRWTSRLAALVFAVTAIVVPGSGAIPVAAQTRAAAPHTLGVVASYSIAGSLAAVAGTSPDNVWAVGFSGEATAASVAKPLVLHWNGKRWSRFAVQDAPYGQVNAISVLSASDAWAVGEKTDATGVYHRGALVEHWNGKTWSQPPGIPQLSSIYVYAVAVDATPHEVWILLAGFEAALGESYDLFLHFIGGHWYVVPSAEAQGFDSAGQAMAVTGPKLAWAGGGYVDKKGYEHSYLLRWNGSVWKTSPVPAPGSWISGMASGPKGAVWAVGVCEPSGVQGAQSMLWDGKRWHVGPVILGKFFAGVGFIPGGTAWAVGSAAIGGTFTARWTGSAWQPVASPNPGFNSELNAVVAMSASDAWAVGSVEPSSNFSVWKTLILHWNGKTWS
jgi:hypothetical protein